MGQIGFTAAAGVFASAAVTLIAGVEVPWLVFSLAFTLIVGFLGYRSVHIGARVLGVLLVAELGVLVVFCVAVLARGGRSGLTLHAFDPSVVFSATVPALFVLTFTAFVGFEQTAIYSREVKDKRRTVSRGTYIAVIFLTVFYAFCAWAILQAIGADRIADVLEGDPSALVFTLNSEFAGETMTALMQLLVVTSFFAGILALQNVGARYLHALGSTGMLPAQLSRVSPTTGSPSVGNVTQATIAGVVLIVFALFGADPYTQVVVWTNSPTIIAVLAMQILTSIAVIRFFRSDRRGESTFVRVIAPAVSIVLLTAALALILSQLGLLTGLDPLGNLLILLPLIVAAVYGFLRGASTSPRAVGAVPTTEMTLPS